MKQIVKKGMAALVGVALVSAAGLAQAETRFAVQDPTGAIDKMVVTDSGFVGTGTSAPVSAIHTKGTTIAGTQIGTQYTGPEVTGSGGFVAFRNQVSATNQGLPIKGDRLGYILFGGYDGTIPRYSSGFFAYADGIWTRTSTPSYYTFETTAAGKVTRNEWMRIASTGNIGVGTTTPTQKLEINGALRLNTATVKPATCSSTVRGTLWLTQGGASVADLLEVCLKDAAGNYSWVKLN